MSLNHLWGKLMKTGFIFAELVVEKLVKMKINNYCELFNNQQSSLTETVSQ